MSVLCRGMSAVVARVVAVGRVSEWGCRLVAAPGGAAGRVVAHQQVSSLRVFVLQGLVFVCVVCVQDAATCTSLCNSLVTRQLRQTLQGYKHQQHHEA
jgi:hypothetical protein